MNEASNRKSWVILIIGLLVVAAIPASSWGARVISIRHGVHRDFDRVVFDLSERCEYIIDTRQTGRSIYVTMAGISADAPEPEIQLSPKSQIVALVNSLGGGTYQICVLTAVTVHSFRIPGSTYRIVIDLYPDKAGDSSQSAVPAEEDAPNVVGNPQDPVAESQENTSIQEETAENPEIVEPAENPIRQDVIEASASGKMSSDPTSQRAVDSTAVSPAYNFKSLYDLKQSALQLQSEGQADSASARWEQYLAIAKQMRRGLVDGDLASADVGSQDENSQSKPSSPIGRILFVFVPIGLAILILVIWIVDRFAFASLFRRNKRIAAPKDEQAEPKPVRTPPTPAAQPAVAAEAAPAEPKPERTQPDPEQDRLEKPTTVKSPPDERQKEEVASGEAEEAALKEFFEAPEEPSAEEEKVKRILELAGEEKSIAEIAEEMGIGEDEVRLVLDLQGNSAPVESTGK